MARRQSSAAERWCIVDGVRGKVGWVYEQDFQLTASASHMSNLHSSPQHGQVAIYTLIRAMQD